MSARSLATSAGSLDRSRATVSGFFRSDDHGGGIGDPGDCEANRQLLLSTHLASSRMDGSPTLWRRVSPALPDARDRRVAPM